jgi:hypothetical protein
MTDLNVTFRRGGGSRPVGDAIDPLASERAGHQVGEVVPEYRHSSCAIVQGGGRSAACATGIPPTGGLAVESGEYHLATGRSSGNLALRTTITVSSTGVL